MTPAAAARELTLTGTVRDGVLSGLEAVYAVHVDPSLRTGKYGLLAGPVTALP